MQLKQERKFLEEQAREREVGAPPPCPPGGEGGVPGEGRPAGGGSQEEGQGGGQEGELHSAGHEGEMRRCRPCPEPVQGRQAFSQTFGPVLLSWLPSWPHL